MELITRSKSAGRNIAAARRKEIALYNTPTSRVARHYNDGASLELVRRGKVEKKIRLGPNCVHAFITHRDGSYTDLGVSYNLLTNIGRDIFATWIGGYFGAGTTVAGCISTAISSSSITATGTPFTASNLATPQLGLTGKCIVANAATPANPAVYGNVVSNTSSVVTIDSWKKVDETAGTTPTSGHAFTIMPASPKYMALTTDSGAASASDTVLASEITASGAGRALATYAHTLGASTMTLSKAFSITGTLTAIHKMGLFCALSAGAGDPMVFESVLNVDATVANGDTLTVTDTITISG